MKIARLYILGLLAATHAHAIDADAVRSKVHSDNALGARALIKDALAQPVPPAEWLQVRKVISRNPELGYDMLGKWDRRNPVKSTNVDRVLAKADDLAKAEQFEQAFQSYQRVAHFLKKSRDKGNTSNDVLYSSVLHAMGESLYGAGRYKDALTALSWISPLYPFYHQVLFERMWAAFRAGAIDRANGAIASLFSSYYDSVLEPEAYIVQFYIYRKLCRTEDLKLVKARAQSFQQDLKSGAYDVDRWAHADPQLRILLDLRNAPANDDDNAERERKMVASELTSRFQAERPRVIEAMDKVFIYAQLGFSSTSQELPAIQALPDHDALLRSGLELWPVEDAEDWLDEFGSHLFIGDSQCASAEVN